jgi:hypothetical protein
MLVIFQFIGRLFDETGDRPQVYTVGVELRIPPVWREIMSVGDEGDVTDDLVLRSWQVITLLGDAREAFDEVEQPELTYILAKVETGLLVIVTEMAKRASRSKRRWGPKRKLGNAARDTLSLPASGWRECLIPAAPPQSTEGVANASARTSSRCASAAALARATIEKVSSSIRFHETTAPGSEAAVRTPLSRLASLKTDSLSRSAIDNYSDVAGTSKLADQIASPQPNLGSVNNDDPQSNSAALSGPEAEGRHRLTIQRGVSISSIGRVVLLAIIAVCPALVIQVWNEYDLRMAREADIRQRVVQVTQQLGEEIGELREGARQMLLAIAQLDPVKSHQTEACRALLSKLKYRFPNYALLGAAGIDGQIYCTSMPISYSSVADQTFFTRAIAQPGLAVGNYWADPANGQRMINFAERFDDRDGYVAGVVFAGLDLGWLSDHLKERGWSPTTSILIADREGNIIVRLPHPETLVGKNMRKSHESIMDGNEAGWEEATGVDGIARIFGYVPAALPPKDFFLSAGQSKAEAFAAIDRSTWRRIGLILAGFFGAICVAWAGGRMFARWPGPDSRKETDGWRIRCNDVRTSSVAQPVNECSPHLTKRRSRSPSRSISARSVASSSGSLLAMTAVTS